jgi:SOS-response transcriptional repressor LexA
VLEAANPSFEDLVFDADEVAIYGKVLSVLRRL